ncbi:hypothetical protein KF913_10895 [Candidatus Obscuribacterales bacterium]|nr:hypothetical protein [Candidatus Obscuribacterales bacterium]
MNSRKLSIGALVVVIFAAFLSYFCKFSPDMTPTVDPKYETSAPELQTVPNPKFAEGILNSNLAMVLIHSDFSDKNALALDALRTWAKEQFSQDIQYLHPVSWTVDESQNTIFSAFVANLMGPARGLLEGGIKQFLRWRVDEFHGTDAYQSFRLDYYNLFGVDPEAATLLVRYQEERAKLATEVITGLLYVITAFASCLTYYFVSKQWLCRGRLALSYGWLSVAFLYIACAWYANEVSFMVSAAVSGLIGLYLRYPVSLSFDEAGYLDVRGIEISRRVVAAVAWISLTLVGIQILTWVKSGSLMEPDPVTLLVCSATGNFFHDPSNIKKTISHVVGVIWILSSLSTLYVLKQGAPATPDLEKQLESLENTGVVR